MNTNAQHYDEHDELYAVIAERDALRATVRELVVALEVTDAAMGKLGTGYALPRRCQIALANARKVLNDAGGAA